MDVKVARSTPRPKISLNNNLSNEDKDNTKQQSNIIAEKWYRFQELKRKREEIESKSNKKTKKANNSAIARKFLLLSFKYC
jgi:hypothetical protein